MTERRSQMRFESRGLSDESLVRRYGERKGWRLATCNVLVEGESDIAYFGRAAELHMEATGRILLGPSFQIIPAGFGRNGGVVEVEQQFNTLQSLIEADAALPLRERVRVIALFDDDPAGRGAFDAVTHKYSKWKAYVDVFLLKRVYPSSPVGDRSFGRDLECANRSWNGLDCEIEDLISLPLLSSFAALDSRSLRRVPTVRAGGHHFEWNAAEGFKRKLKEHTISRASIQDLEGVLNTIRFLRRAFALAPDGDTTPARG